MMHRVWSLSVAALLMSMICMAATAQDGVDPRIAGFDRVDADKDGVITAEEFAAAQGRDFRLLDRDNDGVVGRAEFVDRAGPTAAPPDQRLREARAFRFRLMDTNADGRVTRDEFLAFGRKQFAEIDGNRDGRIARAEFLAFAPRQAPPTSVAPPSDAPPPDSPPGSNPDDNEDELRRVFRLIDGNNDGAIVAAEMDAARRSIFRQLDTDNDGKLSRAEFAVSVRGEAAPSAIDARFAALDRNRDRAIALDEFLAAGRERFRAADTNRDGKLSWDEFRASPAR